MRNLDARGQWREADIAMGTATATRQFHDETGQLAGLEFHNASLLHRQLYTRYDVFGNLSASTIEVPSLSADATHETYVYDNLHRLTRNTRSHASPIHYDYDASGNLLLKDDYANVYHYAGAKPNAVSRVDLIGGGHVTFGYDHNGNRTQVLTGHPP